MKHIFLYFFCFTICLCLVSKSIAADLVHTEDINPDVAAVGFVSECGKYYDEIKSLNAYDFDYYMKIDNDFYSKYLEFFIERGRVKKISSKIIKTLGEKKLYQIDSEIFRLFIYEVNNGKYIPLSLETYCEGLEPKFFEMNDFLIFETTLYNYRGTKTAFYFLFDGDGNLTSSFTLEALSAKISNKSKFLGVELELQNCLKENYYKLFCYDHIYGQINCFYTLNDAYRPRDENILGETIYYYEIDKKGEPKITNYEVENRCIAPVEPCKPSPPPPELYKMEPIRPSSPEDIPEP